MEIRRFLPLMGPLSLLCVWYLVFFAHLVKPVFLPAPHHVLACLLRDLMSRQVLEELAATLGRTIVGFSLAMTVGIPLGLLLGYSSRASQSFEGCLDFLRSIPATALLPLFIVCVGPGETGKIGLVVFAVSLVITMYTMLGVKNCNKARQRYVQTLGVGRMDMFRKVIFFDSLPSTFAGLRIGISLALVLVIVAEMLMMGSASGLGTHIYLARYEAEYGQMYALILIAGSIGYGLNKGFRALGNRLIHWSGM